MPNSQPQTATKDATTSAATTEEEFDLSEEPEHDSSLSEELLSAAELSALVERCGQGDAESLTRFFELYSSDIYNFPLKVFHLDEDAASDFFLYAYERLREGNRFRSFQGRSTFRTWFYTVLRNLLIDWMRTIREVQTVQVGRSDDDSGSEFNQIENSPDPRSLVDESLPSIDDFADRFDRLSIDMRIVFKLSFIYYLELDSEEFAALSDKSGRSESELLRFLSDLKSELAEKEIRNLQAEDKITSLYLSILDLKQRQSRLVGDSGRQKHAVQSAPTVDQLFESERIERSIHKKYQQREKLLQKKEKGHFVVRTPYRKIAELLDMPEGSISVMMMRTLEKIRKA